MFEGHTYLEYPTSFMNTFTSSIPPTVDFDVVNSSEPTVCLKLKMYKSVKFAVDAMLN